MKESTGKMTWIIIGLFVVAMIAAIIVVKYPDVINNSIVNYIKNMIDALSKLIENNLH